MKAYDNIYPCVYTSSIQVNDDLDMSEFCDGR